MVPVKYLRANKTRTNLGVFRSPSLSQLRTYHVTTKTLSSPAIQLALGQFHLRIDIEMVSHGRETEETLN